MSGERMWSAEMSGGGMGLVQRFRGSLEPFSGPRGADSAEVGSFDGLT